MSERQRVNRGNVSATDAPELSVVVPTHNVGLWIGEMLSSILDDQSLPQEPLDFEVIVVDDGSSDDTVEIAEAYAARDPRLHVVRSPGTGGGQARNHGVSLARGDYLAFADGDDLVPRGAYNTMLRKIRATGSDMVVGRFFKLFSDKVWWPVKAWPAFDEERTAVTLGEQPSAIRNRACWNRVFRRSFWVDNEITFPDASRSNDIVPMVRAMLAARFDVVTKTVYVYRDRPGPGSMTARSHSAAGITSYLEQELECARRVAAAGDDRVLKEYASLVLEADGQVALMRGMSRMSEIDAAELEPAREMVAELITLLGPDALAACEPPTRWGWSLVLAGEWADASKLIGDGRPWSKHPVANMLDGLERVLAHDVVPAAELRGPLEDVFTKAAVNEATLGPDDLGGLLAKHRGLVEAVVKAAAGSDVEPGWRLSRILAAFEAGEDLARLTNADGVEPVVATSVALEGRILQLSLGVALRAPEDLRVVLISGSKRLMFPVHLDQAVGDAVTVSVPLVGVPAGSWQVGYVGRDQLSDFEGPIVIRRPLVQSWEGRGATISWVGPPSRHGVEIAPSLIRRGVSRTRRAARRMMES